MMSIITEDLSEARRAQEMTLFHEVKPQLVPGK
jgi:hypothetical protein